MLIPWRGAAAAVVVGMTAVLAWAEEGKDQKVDDATFVKKAASGNLHEVKLGKLAGEKATATEVKRFALKMVKDHTNAQSDLKYAAKSAGVKMPEAMSKEHQGQLARFEKLEDKKFDAAYVRHMIKDHEQAVNLYEKAAKSLKDAELRNYVEKTLPIIREHLASAKKLGEMLGAREGGEKRGGD